MSSQSSAADGADTRPSYMDVVARKVVIFDGAGGTWLQEQDLTAEDYGGEVFEGCTDILVDTRPELIEQMHSEYFEAGADVVETDSFGSFAVPLGEYGIAERARELVHPKGRGPSGSGGTRVGLPCCCVQGLRVVEKAGCVRGQWGLEEFLERRG